jgi:hypothetical protein
VHTKNPGRESTQKMEGEKAWSTLKIRVSWGVLERKEHRSTKTSKLTSHNCSSSVDFLGLCPLFFGHFEGANGGILTPQPHGERRSRLEGIGVGRKGQHDKEALLEHGQVIYPGEGFMGSSTWTDASISFLVKKNTTGQTKRDFRGKPFRISDHL